VDPYNTYVTASPCHADKVIPSLSMLAGCELIDKRARWDEWKLNMELIGND